jgi:long-subunit acyl-CoA synthetase (AMP-forming)
VWSPKQLYEAILNSAAAWIHFGLKKGDVVCFVSYNNDYYVISLFGVLVAGGIVTGTSDKSPHREFIVYYK